MGARSETIIHDGDREIRLLFTNRALADAESQAGKSVIAIANGFSDGSTGIAEVAILLRAGMEAARRDANIPGKAVSLQDAYEVMDAVGFTESATQVMNSVAEVLGYGSGPKNA